MKKVMSHFFNNKKKIFIIAEIGINHRGSFNECVKLIKASAKAGADAAKLQLINPFESYEKGSKSYKEFSNKLFNYTQLKKLKKIAKKNKIEFFVTPGDFHSINIAKKLKMNMYKISSGLLTNIPLINEIAKLKKPMIISTGMGYIEEIKQALSIVKKYLNNRQIAVLKCTSIYPAPYESINLNAMKTLKNVFKVAVGYSDHTLGTETVLAAVSLGAVVIEKHITLNKNFKGADHKISLEPIQFKAMVKKVRNIEKTFGQNNIKPSIEEIKLRKKNHRYIISKTSLKKGEYITLNKIFFKRMKKIKKGTLKPKDYFKIIKKKITRNVDKNTQISFDFFK